MASNRNAAHGKTMGDLIRACMDMAREDPGCIAVGEPARLTVTTSKRWRQRIKSSEIDQTVDQSNVALSEMLNGYEFGDIECLGTKVRDMDRATLIRFIGNMDLALAGSLTV